MSPGINFKVPYRKTLQVISDLNIHQFPELMPWAAIVSRLSTPGLFNLTN
ncbi:MAG: hypothetical protein WBB28_20765 [Crinalium sp.]